MNNKPKERTEYIGIRVTPEEKEALKKLAATAGLSITAFLLGQSLGDKAGEALIKSMDKKDKANQ